MNKKKGLTISRRGVVLVLAARSGARAGSEWWEWWEWRLGMGHGTVTSCLFQICPPGYLELLKVNTNSELGIVHVVVCGDCMQVYVHGGIHLH